MGDKFKFSCMFSCDGTGCLATNVWHPVMLQLQVVWPDWRVFWKVLFCLQMTSSCAMAWLLELHKNPRTRFQSDCVQMGGKIKVSGKLRCDGTEFLVTDI